MKKDKSKLAKRRQDPLKNVLSFKNRSEEMRLLADIVNYEFVDNIKKSLEERKISASEVAEKTGVSKSYVSQIFNNSRHLNIAFITKVRREFGIPLELIDTSKYFTNATFILFNHYSQKIVDNNREALDIPYTTVNEDQMSVSASERIVFKTIQK